MFKKSFLFIIFAALVTLAVHSTASAQMAPLGGTVVLEKDGKTEPVAGALVEVIRTDVKGFYSTKTNKRGEFVFAGVNYGDYVISISAPNCAPTTVSNVKAGQQDIKVIMDPGDGRKFTEAEAKKRGSEKPKSGEVSTELSEDEKKARAEIDRQNAEMTAKNEKIKNADAIAAKSNAEAKAAFDAKNYDLAIAKYSEGIAAVPDFVGSTPILLNGKMEALRLKGFSVYREGAALSDATAKLEKYAQATKLYDEALVAFQQAIAIIKTAAPTTDADELKQRELVTTNLYSVAVETHRLRSFTNSDTAKIVDGAAVFAEYIARQPDPEKKIDVYLKLGDMMRRGGEFEKAVEAYKQVLALKPDHADATGMLGLSLFGLGSSTGDKEKEQEGLNYMQKYIDMAPVSPTDSQQTKELKESIKQAVDYLKNEQKMAPKKVPATPKKKN